MNGYCHTLVANFALACLPFEERQVLLSAPIKSVGATEVEIRIHGDMKVTVALSVDPEGGYPEPEPEPEFDDTPREERIEMPEGSLNE